MSSTTMFVIDIPKGLNENSVLEVIKQLNIFMQQQEVNGLLINFGATTFVTPGGLTPLLAYMVDIPNLRGVGFYGAVNSSEDSCTNRYIERMGFYSALKIEKASIKVKTSGEGKFQELYCFSKQTPELEVQKTNERIIWTFAKENPNRNLSNAIYWCVFEIVDNARNHADSDTNFLFAQKYDFRGLTEFCVADRGLGIRETMGDDDIEKALARCIRQEKGFKSEGLGNGLHFTARLIEEDTSGTKSSLVIISENAKLTVRSGCPPVVRKTDSFWQGTVVILSLHKTLQADIEKIKGQQVYTAEDLEDFSDLYL